MVTHTCTGQLINWPTEIAIHCICKMKADREVGLYQLAFIPNEELVNVGFDIDIIQALEDPWPVESKGGKTVTVEI